MLPERVVPQSPLLRPICQACGHEGDRVLTRSDCGVLYDVMAGHEIHLASLYCAACESDRIHLNPATETRS
jgi:hypothetical protein